MSRLERVTNIQLPETTAAFIGFLATDAVLRLSDIMPDSHNQLLNDTDLSLMSLGGAVIAALATRRLANIRSQQPSPDQPPN
jgi:hypothetical protein